MLRECCGEGEGLPYQPSHPLPPGSVEAFAGSGLPGWLRDGSGLPHRTAPCRDVLVVRLAPRLCTGCQRHRAPARLATLTAPLPDMQRDALPGGRRHRPPAPGLVRLLGPAAPQRPPPGAPTAPLVAVLGAGPVSPRDRLDRMPPCRARAPGDAPRRDGSSHGVRDARGALAATGFPGGILRPMARMTRLLVPVRSTGGPGVSHDQSCCWPPSF